MNKRMRKLIQQLGEAIHDSVSESDMIAGVVQDIRKHGFEVMLMLEATIGLNEIEQEPRSARSSAAFEPSHADLEIALGRSVNGTAFTPQDLKFLRSLRIAVESPEQDSVSGH